MAKKSAAPPKTVTYKVVAGRKTRFITASPETITAEVDRAIAEMCAQ
jgi:hypothetical protein